jgi:hypothetical protein
MSKKRYKSNDINREKIRAVYKSQQQLGWNFYTEREFIENLMANRFNCLLVVYSLFLMAFVTTPGKINKIIVLILGLIITILVGLTLYRICVKLIINLKILHDLEEDQAIPFIDKEVAAMKHRALGNVNWIIGLIIPCIFVLSFGLLIVLVSTGLWCIY